MKRRVMLVVYLFLITMFSFFIFYDYADILAGVDDTRVSKILDDLADAGVEDDEDLLCGNTYCDDNAGEDGISCAVDCVTECNDGVDNDGDGDIDSLDSGCVDANDDFEFTSSGGGGGSGGSGGSGGNGGSPSCGDNTCDAGEDGISCAVDCVTECNDGVDNDADFVLDLFDADCVDANDDS